MKATLVLISSLFIALLFVAIPDAQAANSCYSNPTFSAIQSDLESVPPSLDGLTLVSENQIALVSGFIPRRPLGFSLVIKDLSLFGWKYVPVKESPSVKSTRYKNGDGLNVYLESSQALLNTFMIWEVLGVEPSSATSQKSHYHSAIIYYDGSSQIFEASRVLIEWNDSYIISGFLVKECVDGKMTVTNKVPLAETIIVRQKMWGNSSYPCKK